MKKHYIILGIVLLAGLFFIPALIKSGPDDGGSGGGTGPGDSELSKRIEEIGKKPFEKEDFFALSNEITGLSSAQEINTTERDNYRSTLNIMLQKALAISYEKISKNCYATKISELKAAGDTINKPIEKLKTQQAIHKRYEQALNYRQRINGFLKGQYTESGVTNLKAEYESIISGQVFKNCSKLLQIKNEIRTECAVFRYFSQNFDAIVSQQDYGYIEENYAAELNKYTWYRRALNIEIQKSLQQDTPSLNE